MSSNRKKHRSGRVTWRTLEEQGLLTERHILMAQAMGLDAYSIQEQHRSHGPKDSLLLEWLEDAHFLQYGTCVPSDPLATPENQAEDPSLENLEPDPDVIMNDFLRESGIVPGSDADNGEWYGEVGRLMEEAERDAPMSVGEIMAQDERMLDRQSNLRKAAMALVAGMKAISAVQEVRLFGSVALPLWKEVPRFGRFRKRRVKVYHECATIDLAVEITDPKCAPELRKAIVANCHKLVEEENFLGAEHHMFCLHLVDQSTQQYLGMVCHFNQCPKKKSECDVAGCGKYQHVRILPWFKFKPERLNEHNSLVLYQR